MSRPNMTPEKTLYGCGCCPECRAIASELLPKAGETFAQVLERAAKKPFRDDETVIYVSPEVRMPAVISFGFIRAALKCGGSEGLETAIDTVILAAGPRARA